VAVANGGTGATTAAAARTSLGAASLDSPTFTGTPTLPTGTIATTQTAGNNSTAIATTAFVTAANGTNANLTGPITSVGNATSVASQTGTGTKFVMDTSPTLVTPTLGVATATSVNKVTLTAPATAATLTIANNKTLTANNSLTLAGIDGTTMTFPGTSATVARTDAAQTFAGIQTYSGQIVSSIATGTAPFSVTSTTPVANLNIGGKAAQATVLETARTINGVSFDGSSNITVTSAAGTLTGTTLSSSVVSSSLTSVGTLANLTVTNAIAGSVTGNAATSTKLATARKINGVNFDGTADITIASIGVKITNYSLAPLKPSGSPESASIAPTAADLLASGIIQFTELPRWTTRNLTFPSASSIVAALPNAKVGDTFTIVLNMKDNNNDINYKFDAGGLTNFSSTTLGNSSARSLILTFRVTNITSGSEAVSIY
jgi:hypothetical protein